MPSTLINKYVRKQSRTGYSQPHGKQWGAEENLLVLHLFKKDPDIVPVLKGHPQAKPRVCFPAVLT